MPIDSSIALQTEVADPMKSIASMLNVANTAQGMRARKLEMVGKDQQNQSEGISLQERKNLQSVLANSESYKAQDGTLDFNKILPLVMRAAPTTGMEHVKSLLAAQTAATEGKSKLMAVSAEGRGYLSRAAKAMEGQPLKDIHSGIDELVKQSPELGDSAPWMKNGLEQAFKAGGQAGVDGALKRMSRGLLSAPDQQTMNTPTVATVNDGAQSYGVNMKPDVDGMPVGKPIEGLGFTHQIPPTAPMIDPATGQQGLKGPVGSPAPGQFGTNTQMRGSAGGAMGADPAAIQREITQTTNDLQKPLDPQSKAMLQQHLQGLQAQLVSSGQARPTSGFVPTALPPGQSESIASTQKGVNDHYRGLQDRAQNAAQDIGVLQNIISHAHGASTGIGSDKAAIAQAILGKLGWPSSKASTLDYDLLGKNAAMIQLAGGDTNLAKTLAGAANPNSHMSEEAIRQAAHQIIGQKRMDLEGLKMFTPLKKLSDGGHMEGYNSMLPKYLESADPRIMQLPHMSDAEKSKMKASMSQAEAKAFGAKIRALESFGIKP